MAWVGLIAFGFVCSPLIYWLAHWTPYRIELEEHAWISQYTDKPATRPRAPSAPWNKNFWIDAKVQPLFWTTVAGTQVILALLAYKFSGSSMLPGLALFGLFVLCLAIADAHSQFLPDSMTLSLMWLGLLAQLPQATRTVGPEAAIIGAAFGYGILWMLAKLFRILRKQDGLGHGDMKLMAAAGAWLGPLALPGAILIGSALALVFHGGRMLVGKSKKDDLFAFGPWLAVGVLAAMITS